MNGISDAVSEEVKMIDTNTKWKLVEMSKKKSSNSLKWIYRIKRNAYVDPIKCIKQKGSMV